MNITTKIGPVLWLIIINFILVLAFIIEHIIRYRRLSNKTNILCKDFTKDPSNLSTKEFLKFEHELMKKKWFFAGFGIYNLVLIIWEIVQWGFEIGDTYSIAGYIEPGLVFSIILELKIASYSFLWLIIICAISHMMFSIWRSRILYRVKDALFSVIKFS